MYQRLVAVAVIALILSASTAFGQCGCNSQPVYAPVEAAYASYYAPPAAYAPAPYVSYYAPPVPYTTYYSPYAAYYSPYATFAPVVAPYPVYYRYGVPGWSAYGTPRLYVPGEPVRNVLRAVTP
ncbi:MAG: hypothetical protein ABSF26_07310 [Thermoguttaceae bacterium]